MQYTDKPTSQILSNQLFCKSSQSGLRDIVHQTQTQTSAFIKSVYIVEQQDQRDAFSCTSQTLPSLSLTSWETQVEAAKLKAKSRTRRVSAAKL